MNGRTLRYTLRVSSVYTHRALHFLMPSDSHRSPPSIPSIGTRATQYIMSWIDHECVVTGEQHQQHVKNESGVVIIKYLSGRHRRLLRSPQEIFLVIIQMRRAIKSAGCKHRPFIQKVNLIPHDGNGQTYCTQTFISCMRRKGLLTTVNHLLATYSIKSDMMTVLAEKCR